MDTSLENRAKRIIETPLGSRVMLPTFGSNLFELVDKTINDEYKLRFISGTFQAFYNTEENVLWDRDLEPQQIIFNNVNYTEIDVTINLASGEKVVL